MQFKPDISTAVPDSKMCEVFKSQIIYDDYEYITLSAKIQPESNEMEKLLKLHEKGPILCLFFLVYSILA